MNVWFGTSWDAPVNYLTPKIAVPVGFLCIHCEEPITEEDSGWGQCEGGPYMHIECWTRTLLGSVGHQLKLCACFGGETQLEGDNPEMSKRDSARAAWDVARSRKAED